MRRVLALLATLSLMAGCAATAHPDPLPIASRQAGLPSTSPSPSATPPRPVVAKVSDVMGTGPVFGVSLPKRSDAAVNAVAAQTGCRPKWVQFFASVADTVSTEAIAASSGIPLMSLEPWHPGKPGPQSDFTLQDTLDGKWDEQYRRIARAVIRYEKVVMIRFAHEMNGTWYPWGPVSTNTPAKYAAAWRHVVSLFRQAGATNALWIWSPNIIRGVKSKTIKQWWPGDQWVDLVGYTGYGVNEKSPETTFAGSIDLMHELTKKPLILTETGVQPGETKRAWIDAFGPWLRANPRIAGFIWMERRPDSGKTAGDWRYSDSKANLAAFKRTLTAANVPC